MELTFSLDPNDYKIFCARITKHGNNSAPKYKYVGRFVIFLIWVLLGIFLAYLFREIRTTDQTLLEVFGPSIAIMFVFGILLKIYISIFQRRLEPSKEGFILGERTFRFSEAGIEEIGRHYSNQLRWEAVTDIVDDPEYIYLFLDVSAAHIIPKQIFPSKDAVNEFVENIESLRKKNAA